MVGVNWNPSFTPCVRVKYCELFLLLFCVLSRLFLSIVLEDFSHCNSCIETNANFDNGLVLKIVKLKKKDTA